MVFEPIPSNNRYNGGRECPNAWVYKAAGTFEE